MRYPIIYLFFVFSLSLISQSGFKRQFKIPGATTSLTKAIFETQNGDFIAAGIIVDTVNGYTSNRLVIMGLSNQGHLLWIKKYGNYKFQYINNPYVIRSFYFHNNNLYCTSAAIDSNANYVGVFLKFDVNGDTLWQKIFKDSTHQLIPQMCSSSLNSGFIVTGYCNDPINMDNNPVLLIKTDLNGNELWRKKINKVSINYHDGCALKQDSASKKIVIVGFQALGSTNSWTGSDNILILDSLGNKLSQSTFCGAYGGSLRDLIQTKDNKFVAIGQNLDAQTIGGTHLRRSFAIKFDIDSLNVLPIWKINGFDKSSLGNSFTCLRELDNGDIIVAGGIDTMQLYNMNTNILNRLTIIDKNGHVRKSFYYDYKINSAHSDNFQSIMSLEKTSDKGFVVAIQQDNSEKPNPMFFVKFDSTYCDSSADYCRSRAVGIESYIFQDSKFKVYPNPSSGVINIEVNTALEKPLSISISDALGRVVKQLSLRESTKIDLSDLKEGIYFLQVLENGSVIATEKIIRD